MSNAIAATQQTIWRVTYKFLKLYMAMMTLTELQL
jgi:hypothetical protein